MLDILGLERYAHTVRHGPSIHLETEVVSNAAANEETAVKFSPLTVEDLGHLKDHCKPCSVSRIAVLSFHLINS